MTNASARRMVIGITLAVLAALPAAAASLSVFQHGGRAAGQAGAFTARAADPAAVTYNPAAITRLDGFQLQAGLDFSAPLDEYQTPQGSHNARHLISFPPAAYATWTPERAPVSWGLGIDSPVFFSTRWPVASPGRFLASETKVRVYELHGVLAFEVDDHWSVGGGVRYLSGQFGQELSALVPSASGALFEAERKQDADVDGLGGDLAVHFTTEFWGFGAVARSGIELEGSTERSVRLRDAAVPDANIAGGLSRLEALPADESFELPLELRAGVWLAPYPELRLELDAALQAWSQVDNHQAFFPNGDTRGVPVVRDRDWKDTMSLRLGIEGDLTDNWAIGFGVAVEPSPVPNSTLEPGFPRADALVYATGLSYDFPQLSFDLGYSFHDYDSRGASGQELRNPTAGGRYSARDQVFSVSARWRY